MIDLLKKTFERVRNTHHAEYSAALAFYVMVSIIPLIVLTISIFSYFVPAHNLEQQIVTEISSLLGNQLAQAATVLIESEAGFDTSGFLAVLWGVLTLLWGSSRLFEFVYLTVNEAWDVDEEDAADGLKGWARKRFVASLFTFVAGFMIFFLSFADTIIRRLFRGIIPPGIEVRFIIFGLTTLSLAFLFASIYKVLPDETIDWPDALIGGALTSVLFMVGQVAISLLLENRSITASVGLAGAMIIFMTWVYYSARVFMVGAAFTHVYAHRDEVIS